LPLYQHDGYFIEDTKDKVPQRSRTIPSLIMGCLNASSAQKYIALVCVGQEIGERPDYIRNPINCWHHYKYLVLRRWV